MEAREMGRIRKMLDADPIGSRPTLPAPPEADDLLCPRCSTPSHPVAMRTRGEVRVHFWQCGCVVAPEVRVESFGVLGERLHVARGHAIEELHPTEAGAIAAWRVALEQRQREDDERASTYESAAPWICEGGEPAVSALTGYHETQGEFEAALNAEIERATIGHGMAEYRAPTGDEVHRARTLARWEYDAGCRLHDQVRFSDGHEQPPTGGDPTGKAVRELIHRRTLARERECIATLPDRTDDEVRQVAAACTEATHVETLVAVANECARRWPSRAGAVERFDIDRGSPVLLFRDGRREDTTSRLVAASARLYAGVA